MRDAFEVYRWMWQELGRRRDAAGPVRIVLFVDAVAVDLVRTMGLTLGRVVARVGRAIGRTTWAELFPTLMRAAGGLAFCVLLFGPFIVVLGDLQRPRIHHGTVEVSAAGWVSFSDQRMNTEQLGRVLRRWRVRSVEVRIDAGATAGMVQAVRGALVDGGVRRARMAPARRTGR